MYGLYNARYLEESDINRITNLIDKWFSVEWQEMWYASTIFTWTYIPKAVGDPLPQIPCKFNGKISNPRLVAWIEKWLLVSWQDVWNLMLWLVNHLSTDKLLELIETWLDTTGNNLWFPIAEAVKNDIITPKSSDRILDIFDRIIIMGGHVWRIWGTISLVIENRIITTNDRDRILQIFDKVRFSYKTNIDQAYYAAKNQGIINEQECDFLVNRYEELTKY